LAHYADWYNNHRPHQALDGRTPQDVYSGAQPQAPPSHSIPNSKLPVMELAVTHLHGNKLLPVVELRKAA